MDNFFHRVDIFVDNLLKKFLLLSRQSFFTASKKYNTRRRVACPRYRQSVHRDIHKMKFTRFRKTRVNRL